MTTPLHPGEPTEESRLAFEGKLFNVRVDQVRLANGRKATREIVVAKNSVCVVPVDDSGNLYLVRQYRKPPERLLLEVVAGGIDEGESPEAAARRELLEEAGLHAQSLELLSFFWMTPGFCTEGMHTFLATQLQMGQNSPRRRRIHRNREGQTRGSPTTNHIRPNPGLQNHRFPNAHVGTRC